MLGVYLRERLRDRSTYVVAGIVGTLINVYGQLLVPFLRGNPHPLDALADEFGARPVLLVSSVLVGYCFPLLVGAVSAALTRHATRHIEERAWFPDAKPDPVFRCSEDGAITDSGAVTQAMLSRHAITNAAQLLGPDIWARVIEAHRGPARGGQGVVVRCAPLREDYLLSHAAAPNGEVQVYLTRRPRAEDAA